MLLDIVTEEIERLEELLEFYEKELIKYPKGYLSKRNRKGNIYYYRSYREGKKVKTIYIGIEDSDAVKMMIKQMVKKQTLVEKLKQVKSNLKEAKRLYGRRKKAVSNNP